MANMKTTKNAYLEKLTKQIQMKSVKVGKVNAAVLFKVPKSLNIL